METLCDVYTKRQESYAGGAHSDLKRLEFALL